MAPETKENKVTIVGLGKEFHRACAENELSKVKELISQNKNLSTVILDDKVLIDELFNNESDAKWISRAGIRPIHTCVYRKSYKVLDLLLQYKDANVNIKTAHGKHSTALHIAAHKNDVVATNILLQHKAKIVSDDNHNSPIFLAIQNNSIAVLKRLLQHFDNIEPETKKTDDPGENALHIAAFKNNPEAIEVLMEIENIKIKCNESNKKGNTPLWVAMIGRKNKAISKLIKYPDIDVNARNKTEQNRTPLHYAASNDNAEAGKELLTRKDLEVEIKDDFGSTPLNASILSNNQELTTELLCRVFDIPKEHEEVSFVPVSVLNQVFDSCIIIDNLGEMKVSFDYQLLQSDDTADAQNNGIALNTIVNHGDQAANSLGGTETELENTEINHRNNSQSQDVGNNGMYEMENRGGPTNQLAIEVDGIETEGQEPEETEKNKLLTNKTEVQEPEKTEMNKLLTICQMSDSHKTILKHPVVESFLWMKWQKLETFHIGFSFFKIIVLGILFAVVAKEYSPVAMPTNKNENIMTSTEKIAYTHTSSTYNTSHEFLLTTLSQHCDKIEEMTELTVPGLWLLKCSKIMAETPKIEQSENFIMEELRIILGILVTILILVELFELMTGVKNYFKDMTNYFQLPLYAGCLFLAFDSDPHFYQLRAHFAAIILPFYCLETLGTVLKHPSLSHVMQMLIMVSSTFFKYLIWYIFIFLTFAFSFFILFGNNQKIKDGTLGNFSWRRLFAYIFILSVGEADDYPLTSVDDDITTNQEDFKFFIELLFITSFLIFVVIVLMNLMNGLAVTDAEKMRKDSKIITLHSLLHLLCFWESICLGNSYGYLQWSLIQFPKTWLRKFWKDYFSVLYSHQAYAVKPFKSEAKKYRRFFNFKKWYLFTPNPNCKKEKRLIQIKQEITKLKQDEQLNNQKHKIPLDKLYKEKRKLEGQKDEKQSSKIKNGAIGPSQAGNHVNQDVESHQPKCSVDLFTDCGLYIDPEILMVALTLPVKVKHPENSMRD